MPSSLPGLPANPASVVTTPAGVTFRMVLLPMSDTYTLPALSTAAPNGMKKRARLPAPSVLPGPSSGAPAKVVKVYSWAVAWVLAAMTTAADRRPIEREGLRSFISV